MKPDQPSDDASTDLADWAHDFRASEKDTKMPSADEVMKQAERDTRDERLAWVGQVGGTLFAGIVFVVLVAKTRSALLAVLAAVVLPTLFALFGFFVYVQVGARASGKGSIAEHVAQAVRRRRANHLIAWASLAALLLMTTVFWVWLPFFILSRIDRFGPEPWRAVIGVSAGMVVFGLAGWRTSVLVRKTKAERERWEAIEASLKTPDA